MWHFLTGKVLSALVGLIWLFSLVRALPIADYGVYVALTGYFELFILASSLGLVSAVERYVPALRTSAGDSEVGAFIAMALLLRTLTLAGLVAVAGIFAVYFSRILGVSENIETFRWFQIIVFAEGVSRLIDSCFDCLLLQKYAQISILTRNILRLLSLLSLWTIFPSEVNLLLWVKLEAVCAIVGMIVAVSLLRRNVPLRLSKADFRSQRASLGRYVKYSVPTYLAQMAGMFGGIEAAKLIVSANLPANHVAEFGFCAMLALMAQRYLPTTLLMGMLRPLFVSAANLPTRDEKVNKMFATIVKLNIFFVAPLIAFVLVLGSLFVDITSAGKFAFSGEVLLLLLLYVAVQGIKIAHNLVLVTLEDGSGALWTLGIGAAVFWLMQIFLPNLTVKILILSLVTGDLFSIFLMRYRINAQGLKLIFPYMSFAKMLLLVTITAFVLSNSMLALESLSNSTRLIFGFGVAVFVHLLCGAWLKPFSQDERDSINRILPAKVFVW